MRKSLIRILSAPLHLPPPLPPRRHPPPPPPPLHHHHHHHLLLLPSNSLPLSLVLSNTTTTNQLDSNQHIKNKHIKKIEKDQNQKNSIESNGMYLKLVVEFLSEVNHLLHSDPPPTTYGIERISRNITTSSFIDTDGIVVTSQNES